MGNKIFKSRIIIKETNLDFYGHVNNAMYMTVLEQARWDFITEQGYGLKRILETGLGPVILEAKLTFLKELRLHEEIVIESQTTSFDRKIGKMAQKMKRREEVCCDAEFTFGFFHLKDRKLVMPTPDWLKAFGLLYRT